MSLTDGMVEFWTFNDSLIGVNGNTLVSPDGLEHYVEGKIGRAWDVAGVVGQAAYLHPSPAWFRGDFTVAFWINMKSQTDTRAYFNVQDTVAGTTIGLFCFSPSLTLGISGSFMFTALPQDNQWVLLTIRGNAATRRARLDYNTINQLDFVSENWADDAGIQTFSFGVAGTAPSLSVAANAAYDSAGVWARELTDDELSEFYNSGLGWEPSAQTLKQHLLVSPSGRIQPVGSSIIVPGWV